MMKNTILLFFFTICIGNIKVHGQVSERVYLQTDKQLYMAGELLRLKLYTTDADGKLMDFSKIGYIELIRDSIPEAQIKIAIQDGIGTGWMELPTMLPTGYYRIIAYTRYMRNESEIVFFEKTITIVNSYRGQSSLNPEETNTSFSFKTIEKSINAPDISVDKPFYTKRNKGEIHIKGLPAENIFLGISIAGIDPFSWEVNPTIYEWKNQLSTNNTPFVDIHFLPEYEGAIIDGILIDLETKNPVFDPNVINLLSFPGKEIRLFAGQTNENGNVAFYTQCITGKHELATTAIASLDKRYSIVIQTPYALHTPANLPLFIPDSTWIDYLRLRYLSVQVDHTYIADSLSIIKEVNSCVDLIADVRYELDEYTRFANMEEVFIEFIPFARIRRTNEGRKFSIVNERRDSYGVNTLVLFDNIPVTDHELMSAYNPLLIKTINLHFGNYIFGGHLFDGIISFHSYNNNYPGMTFSESTHIYDYEGIQPYRYFYTPNYDGTNISSPLPDFRHTLLWEPSIQSKGQNELTIPFTTSDIPGSYLISVEGIGENGTIIHVNHIIEVE
jgi:Large extracellular alpha-helical protein